MREAVIGLGWLAAMALAGTAMAQQTATPGQGGPQPNHAQENQGSGLFSPNQTAPTYSTGANAGTASMQHSNSAEPNAGNTGATGSGGTTQGTPAPAYSTPQSQR